MFPCSCGPLCGPEKADRNQRVIPNRGQTFRRPGVSGRHGSSTIVRSIRPKGSPADPPFCWPRERRDCGMRCLGICAHPARAAIAHSARLSTAAYRRPCPTRRMRGLPDDDSSKLSSSAHPLITRSSRSNRTRTQTRNFLRTDVWIFIFSAHMLGFCSTRGRTKAADPFAVSSGR